MVLRDAYPFCMAVPRGAYPFVKAVFKGCASFLFKALIFLFKAFLRILFWRYRDVCNIILSLFNDF